MSGHLPAENLEQLLVSAGDNAESVLCLVRIVRRESGIGVSIPFVYFLRYPVPGECVFQRHRNTVGQSYIHLLASSNQSSGMNRRQHSNSHVHSAQDISHGISRPRRLPSFRTGKAHQAPHGLRQNIVTGAL